MPPLNEEDQQTVKDLISAAITGVVGNLKKGNELAISKAMETSQVNFVKVLDEKLAAFKPAEPVDDGKGGKGGGGKDLQISTLTKQIETLTQTQRETSDRAARAEKRRREMERTNAIVQNLAKGGVADPFMQELAVSYFDRRGYVPLSEDEESTLVWRGTDGVDVSFDEGISSWLKTEEAKRFLPPTGAGGSGGRRPAARPAGAKKTEATFEDVGNWALGLAGQTPARNE